MTRTYPVILFLTFVFISTIKVNAQFTPSQTRISTPYGPRTITTYQHSPLMRYGNIPADISQKYSFTIVLLNDSLVMDRGRININDSIHSITFKEKGTKTIYRPSETKELYRIMFDGTKFTGIPKDTCWLFKTEPGKINLYSCVAEKGVDLVTAIQSGDDGPIENITKARVIELVKLYPRLLALAEKGKLVKALRGYNKMKE